MAAAFGAALEDSVAAGAGGAHTGALARGHVAAEGGGQKRR